jgi:hypothetical protein
MSQGKQREIGARDQYIHYVSPTRSQLRGNCVNFAYGDAGHIRCCPKVLDWHDTEADEVTIRDADTGEVEEDHGGIRLS